jgi:hypothetical protein
MEARRVYRIKRIFSVFQEINLCGKTAHRIRRFSMGQLDVSRKKNSSRQLAKKDIRSLLPKPIHGILDEKDRARLFEFVNSLKNTTMK